MKCNVIKSLRLSLCWEQDKLAKEIGVTRQAISHWETGKRIPKLSLIRKLDELAKKHKIKFNKDELMKGH